jgi:phosphoserine aminotransferase
LLLQDFISQYAATEKCRKCKFAKKAVGKLREKRNGFQKIISKYRNSRRSKKMKCVVKVAEHECVKITNTNGQTFNTMPNSNAVKTVQNVLKLLCEGGGFNRIANNVS